MRAKYFGVVLSLLLLSFGNVARATQSLTLLEPASTVYARETTTFEVAGDRLTRVYLRIFRLKGTSNVTAGHGARVLVTQTTATSPVPRSRLKLRVQIPAAGWYQAEVSVDGTSGKGATNFDDITFAATTRPIPGRPVPSLQLEAPEALNPPGTAPFKATGILLRRATLRVWKLLPGGAQALLFSADKPMPPRPKIGTKAYDSYEAAIKWSVRLPSAGAYLAEAQSGNLRRLKYIRVSDIGLVTKRAPRELLVYAVRLSTGKPLPRAAIRVDDRGVESTRMRNGRAEKFWIRRPEASRALSTGADGVARFGQTPASGVLSVSAAAGDGSRVYNHESGLQNSGADSDLKVLFYTERPIYRPGQTVYFKGIARRDLSPSGRRGPHGEIFVPVSNARVELEFTDAQNDRIETTTALTNAQGSFAGRIALRVAAPVGRYAVEMKLKPSAGEAAQSFYGRFTVQEYRKPEYEVTLTPRLSQPYAPQGQDIAVVVNARYFFGGPVKGATLKYSGDASGETKLDDNGEAIITILNPVSSNAQDATRTLNARVIDEANRIVESSTSILAPWSLVKPSLKFDKSVYDLQQFAKIQVRTVDPIGRPVSATARVRLYFTRSKRIKNRETLRWEETSEEVMFEEQSVQTDRFGVATLSARLGRGGYIRADVSARDINNREQHWSTNIWVLSKEQSYWGNYNFPGLEVLLDKTSYVPGETVRALITTSKEGATALITLQGDRIFMHRVIPLTGRVTLFEFVFPESAAPGAHLVAGIASGRQWISDGAYVRAVSPAQTLAISVRAAKNEYRPGTTARYAINVRDGLGRPQRAEVSLGLVDKAIYGLATDETPDPTEFFYGTREDRIATSWEFPGEIAGGSYQRIEKSVPIRRNFQDTAFWNPFVQTDANGQATLDIPLPDNLTTWRATARGITLDTKAGAATSEVLVTKPLLTRLILPRFVTQTDRVRAQVIVQNNTNAPQNLRVSLRGTDIETASVGAETKGAQSATVKGGQSASFYWTIGTDEAIVGGVAKLTATARSGDDATTENSDAQELPLPVLPRGVAQSLWRAGAITDGIQSTLGNANQSTFTLAQPLHFVRNAGKLEVSVSPSLAGPMLAALPNLIGYPYGCTEQTLSRFVPSIVASRALQKLHLPQPEVAAELPKIVAAGLSTLYGYQHKDGGWGWWPDDDTDPYLTAYAVYGLSLAREAGYEIDRARVVRGVVSIQNQFGQSTLDADSRAFMMLAYATAMDVWHLDLKTDLNTKEDYPAAVFEARSKLSNYGLASLALAYSRLNAETHVAEATSGAVTLSGEAALFYLWKNHRPTAKVGIYYLSQNGRIYYRDAQTHQAIWVEVPKNGIRLSAAQAAPYREFAGYDNRANGRTLRQISPEIRFKDNGEMEVDAPQPQPIAIAPVSPRMLAYRAGLNVLLDLLESRARQENGANGPVVSWQSGDPNGSGWNDSDIEATALALQVLVRARPQSKLILPSISWLLQSRRGTQWQSTKDTAQVVIALADYLSQTNELAPDETVKVLLGGQTLREIHFTQADIGKPDVTIALDGLNEDARVEIQRSGRGSVYYAAKLTAFETDTLPTGADNGFKVERHYQVQNEKGWWRDVVGPVPNGTLVRVDLRVSVAQAREYVLLEDKLPSGFEARPEDDAKAQTSEEHADCILDKMVVTDPPPGWSALPVSRRDAHDNRQAFFIDRLAPGQYYLRYILRPEQTGPRVALPTHIEAMYRPDFNGHSAENALEVK